jgi:hypothetical protein
MRNKTTEIRWSELDWSSVVSLEIAHTVDNRTYTPPLIQSLSPVRT